LQLVTVGSKLLVKNLISVNLIAISNQLDMPAS